jgi:copper chaperone CopZ
LGIEHFDYDLSSSQAKIIYKREEVTQEHILKCIKDLGYEPYVSDVIEDEEYA